MDATLLVDAEVKNLPRIRRYVKNWAEAHHAPQPVVEGLVMAVDESATNIVTHGYRGLPGEIEVRLSLEGDVIVACLLDEAPLFDPTTRPPPDLTLPLEQRVFGGLGIFLARSSVDGYSYRVTEDGRNELTLRKRISEA